MVADTENIRKLESYLNFKSRVRISDGRVFIGTFVCIDKDKNIILAHTEEFRGNEKRLVGLVMIPGKHLVKVETEDLETVDSMYT
ncbi:N-alpha-acetyltransferase 38, NatC auxiliary subunit [Choanephora cucurbitarum]|uniref:N-alpha-acetyltransferase 38, NatC auxiliary subunit n=1 Tax=Choanephora cucurbitarum TaxID=101091 RepID=A0A1C7MWS2_9FUNG|nr:N-alpha-acetyltransferase 38, NatC auxiliary subunit [Choanephora cucurbitarum]